MSFTLGFQADEIPPLFVQRSINTQVEVSKGPKLVAQIQARIYQTAAEIQIIFTKRITEVMPGFREQLAADLMRKKEFQKMKEVFIFFDENISYAAELTKEDKALCEISHSSGQVKYECPKVTKTSYLLAYDSKSFKDEAEAEAQCKALASEIFTNQSAHFPSATSIYSKYNCIELDVSQIVEEMSKQG